MRVSARGSVSVVIPCYNSAHFLPDTLQSVFAQTVENPEIIVVDDGSVDHTRAYIEGVMARHPDRRLRLLTQANGGVASARNLGIAAAQGPYILPLDADDLIEPTMLASCAAVLDKEAHVSIVYTDRCDFGDVEQVYAAGIFALERLKYFNQIAYCSLFRKSMWEDVGGYRPNVSGFDDWDFWIASAARGFQGKHLPEPLVRHRRHRSSQLWTVIDNFEALFAQIILNNQTVYSSKEVQMAMRFIEHGERSALLRSSKFVFMHRYYEGYNNKRNEAAVPDKVFK